MLILDKRLATLKYLTLGSSGVAGLKTSFRYAEVRFEYAGESTMDRRRVVNDDGNDENESESGEDCGFGWGLAGVGGGFDSTVISLLLDSRSC
jgi:hypothetical protein